MRILLVEDDAGTAAEVARGLTGAGHLVNHVPDGRAGLMEAIGGGYDLLVVDRMLPNLDGLGLVRALRAAGVATPTLMLTARAGLGDRVEGLDAGADDYLAKPFAFAELLARVHALGRRPALNAEPSVLRVADLEMDLLRRSVTRAGQRIELQPREFRLLEVLLRQAGRVVTRNMLLEQVWDIHFDPRTSVVETHISRLRAKLGEPTLIHTLRGAGYVARPPDA
ncbi:winged helix-turn-helix domain-containing protein [Falsiroseomonas tokyonensis]|uniref:Winged helix-turn-helix domain-containing protein n=1 Tax=Falsiroseomonas tokyonensis TaxID=430521 RepID=A0ABV7BQJ1_9PROT|nr:response regulator transcription factor [Falsiroseomonas tokyonensis]MBU8536373.1 response regulator transcription factor [Falsiroseomonas tokyonensis]